MARCRSTAATLVTVANDISGTGGVTHIGTGTTILTGALSFTGGATIVAGTLQVGASGGAGILGLGDVVNNGTLTVGGSDNVTFDDVISGSGGLVKDGAGELTLTGNNTYTGPTSVTAGLLRINGALASTAVTVAAGATLGGTGSLAGSVLIGAGGTMAPGASPGTLTVGSLTLDPTSTLDYELATPGVVGGGINDLIVVTGDLALDGLLNVTDVGGFGLGIVPAHRLRWRSDRRRSVVRLDACGIRLQHPDWIGSGQSRGGSVAPGGDDQLLGWRRSQRGRRDQRRVGRLEVWRSELDGRERRAQCGVGWPAGRVPGSGGHGDRSGNGRVRGIGVQDAMAIVIDACAGGVLQTSTHRRRFESMPASRRRSPRRSPAAEDS